MESGDVYFDTSINNHQGHVTNKKTGLIVSMTSLDDFIFENNLCIDFIKIDVEGGEAAVLNGFKNNITSMYPTIIVELHGVEQAKKVAHFFRPLNYTLCKLKSVKSSNNNKRPLLSIDNSSDRPEALKNMYGKVIAIPNKNLEKYLSYLGDE